MQICSCPAWCDSQDRLLGDPAGDEGFSDTSFVPGTKWQLDKPRPHSGGTCSGAGDTRGGEIEGDGYPVREEYIVEVFVAVLHGDSYNPARGSTKVIRQAR
jgi:hypothetical protein